MVNTTTSSVLCIFISYLFTYLQNHYSANIKDRDLKKKTVCKSLGITLITIPYWWDKKADSVATTIYVKRPDLGFLRRKGGQVIPAHDPKTSQSKETVPFHPGVVTNIHFIGHPE